MQNFSIWFALTCLIQQKSFFDSIKKLHFLKVSKMRLKYVLFFNGAKLLRSFLSLAYFQVMLTVYKSHAIFGHANINLAQWPSVTPRTSGNVSCVKLKVEYFMVSCLDQLLDQLHGYLFQAGQVKRLKLSSWCERWDNNDYASISPLSIPTLVKRKLWESGSSMILVANVDLSGAITEKYRKE